MKNPKELSLNEVIESVEKIDKSEIKIIKRFDNASLYKVKYQDRGYVMKRYYTNKNCSKIKSEIYYGFHIDHPHILKCIGVAVDEDPDYLCVLFENFGKDLFEYFKLTLSEHATRFIVRQVLDGLECLHDLGIIHRDIKQENILIKDKLVKICDLGEMVMTPRTKSIFGTLEYMAPEMVLNQYIDSSVDIWAIGVLIYELIYGSSPFGVRDESLSDEVKNEKISKNIAKIRYKIPEEFSPELTELLEAIFQKDPSARPTIKNIREFQWFSKYQKKI